MYVVSPAIMGGVGGSGLLQAARRLDLLVHGLGEVEQHAD